LFYKFKSFKIGDSNLILRATKRTFGCTFCVRPYPLKKKLMLKHLLNFIAYHKDGVIFWILFYIICKRLKRG